jgi:hypothetical protein
MQDWKIKKRIPVDYNDVVRARIAYIFYQLGLPDEDILDILQENGYSISIKSVVNIRKATGIYRRTTNGAEDTKRAIELLETLLQNDYPIDDRGKTFLVEAIRKKRLLIAKSDSYEICLDL